MSASRLTTPRIREDSSDTVSFGRLLAAVTGTLALILLANRTNPIGERIPLVFLSLWLGSAAIVALVFVPGAGVRIGSHVLAGRRRWASKMRVAGTILLPLALIPILEVRHSGHDPMIWLMDAALVISLCSTPYFAMLTRTVVGAVALTWGAAILLWLPCSVALFQVVKRAEAAKEVSTVDTANTMHAFFALEYRYLFYALSAMIVFLYCPTMLVLSYRRFSRSKLAA